MLRKGGIFRPGFYTQIFTIDSVLKDANKTDNPSIRRIENKQGFI
jgi:hypothetical protein